MSVFVVKPPDELAVVDLVSGVISFALILVDLLGGVIVQLVVGHLGGFCGRSSIS